jgi:hypothetical protein
VSSYRGLEDVGYVHIVVPFRERGWREIWRGDLRIYVEKARDTHRSADLLVKINLFAFSTNLALFLLSVEAGVLGRMGTVFIFPSDTEDDSSVTMSAEPGRGVSLAEESPENVTLAASQSRASQPVLG